MQKSLVTEEINRINFLMNYDSNKLVTEQKTNFVSESLLFEQVTAPTKRQPQQVQQQLTPQQTQAAKQKIQAAANKSAQTIYGELLKALDMDGDKDLRDSDGTNEGGALTAIKKIKNRETLDALNKIVASWKQYPNLKSWLNAEMSDFDSEYGDIWTKLEKMGYAGANRNILLKVAGNTGVGQMIKAGDKVIDKLRSLSLEQIMEGFREIVSGAVGTVGTLILSFLGPIGAGINVTIYGVLFAWDVNQWNNGKPDIFNIILDLLSLVLSSIGFSNSLKPVAGAKAAFAAEKTSEGFFKILAQKFPKIAKILTPIVSKIASAGQWVISTISKAITWLITKLPMLAKFGNMLKGALSSVGGFIDEIVKGIKATAPKLAANVAKLSQGASKLLSYGTKYLSFIGKWAGSKITTFIASNAGAEILKEVDEQIVKYIEKYLVKNGEKSAETLRPGICKLGTTYCNTFDIIMNGLLIAHQGKDFLKAGKKGMKKIGGLKDVSKNQKLIKNVEKVAKATEGGAKTVKAGYKGYKEVAPRTQTVSNALMPNITQQPQQQQTTKGGTPQQPITTAKNKIQPKKIA